MKRILTGKRILMVLGLALLISALMSLNAFAVPPGHNYNCPGFVIGTTSTVAGLFNASKGQATQFQKQYPGATCTAS